MLQGVYIFVIFVLKRNVYLAITGKKAGRSGTGRAGASGSSRNPAGMGMRKLKEKEESESMFNNTNSTHITEH